MPPPMIAMRDVPPAFGIPEGRCADAGARELQEVSTGQAQLPAFFLHGLHAASRPFGLLEILEERLELPNQGRAGHLHSLHFQKEWSPQGY